MTISVWVAPTKKRVKGSKKPSRVDSVIRVTNATTSSADMVNIQDVIKSEKKAFKAAGKGLVKNRDQKEAKAEIKRGTKPSKVSTANRGLDSGKGFNGKLIADLQNARVAINERLSDGEKPFFNRMGLDNLVSSARQKRKDNLRLTMQEIRYLVEAGDLERENLFNLKTQFHKDNRKLFISADSRRQHELKIERLMNNIQFVVGETIRYKALYKSEIAYLLKHSVIEKNSVLHAGLVSKSLDEK